MKFFRSKIVAWVIVVLMILGLVAIYMPLLFTPEEEPIPISDLPAIVLPSSPLVLVPTSTSPTPAP